MSISSPFSSSFPSDGAGPGPARGDRQPSRALLALAARLANARRPRLLAAQGRHRCAFMTLDFFRLADSDRPILFGVPSRSRS